MMKTATTLLLVLLAVVLSVSWAGVSSAEEKEANSENTTKDKLIMQV